MRDIARRVGVSTATVSLVLRNHPSISAGTRDRVLGAQREMGYKVNRFARQFVRDTRPGANRSKLDHLAFVLIGTSFDNVAYSPFLHGIASECQQHDINLLSQSLKLSEAGVVPSTAIRDGQVDGIIISGLITDAVIAPLRELSMPLVVLGNYFLQSPVARVELDMRDVGARLAAYLAGRGHRTIAFIVENRGHAYESLCLEGIRAHLSQHGLSLPDSQVVSIGHSYAVGPEFVEPFLSMSPSPTAIITTDTRVAEECVGELRARQVEVPEKVEVVSLAVSATRPRGSRYRCINLGLERCGRLAVKRLVELGESPQIEPSLSSLAATEWLDSVQRRAEPETAKVNV